MRTVLGVLHALNVLFWALSILLLALILVVPVLRIDRNFTVNFALSPGAITGMWDGAMFSALGNSVALSVVASLFAIVCGGLLSDILRKTPHWLFIIVVGVYAVNPVVRALSYFDLFHIYTPVFAWSAALFGDRPSSTIVLPALVLGIHYFPVYLMRHLFVVKQRNMLHDLPPLLESLFDDVPLWVRGFPISFALFFLLTFFDYWVIQMISGNTALYWTPLFIQKGFQARAVSEAAFMIVVGLVATFVAYLVAQLLCSSMLFLWRKIRPLWFAHMRGQSSLMLYGRRIAGWSVVLLLSWPLWWSLVSAIRISSMGTLVFMPRTARAIFVMLGLGAATATLSVCGGFALSVVYQEHPRRRAWWLPALYFLALVPEAAYVLFSLVVTGSGLLKGNIFWLLFLMASFSIPISFFLWESLWGNRERQKLWMIGSALLRDPLQAMTLAGREWRRQAAIAFVVVFWLTTDNVFITDFAAGPKWKPLSSVVFNATKRGFSDAELLSSFLGMLAIIVVIGCVMGVSGYMPVHQKKRD
ncbi:hypothetical protein FJZ27_03880 [Candidatus Peribacteria bacterium]|nr:hypothetical protein [Candidatus Peribacteria bacterium]